MLWALDGEDAYTRERLLPRDTVELLINLGGPHRLLSRPGAEARTFDEAWIAGLQDSWLDIESPPNAKLIGVRFLPGGCHRVFGLAVDTLFGRVVDLDDIVGPIAREWRARLLEAPDMETRLSSLEAWMTERLLSVDRGLHGAVTLALHELGRSQGSTPIRALAREAGISHKHLIDLFVPRSGSRPRPSRGSCGSRRCCGTCTPVVSHGREPRTASASAIRRTSISSSAHFRDTRPPSSCTLAGPRATASSSTAIRRERTTAHEVNFFQDSRAGRVQTAAGPWRSETLLARETIGS